MEFSVQSQMKPFSLINVLSIVKFSEFKINSLKTFGKIYFPLAKQCNFWLLAILLVFIMIQYVFTGMK